MITWRRQLESTNPKIVDNLRTWRGQQGHRALVNSKFKELDDLRTWCGQRIKSNPRSERFRTTCKLCCRARYSSIYTLSMSQG